MFPPSGLMEDTIMGSASLTVPNDQQGTQHGYAEINQQKRLLQGSTPIMEYNMYYSTAYGK